MAGVIYTATTDSSVDWTGVTNNSYFYDKTTKLVYYKNTSGVVVNAYDTFTGGTVNGITATTISASTYSNLPSPSITVGTSQITSGTDGRVLFQSGTTLQQDGAFNWDNTNKRLGIGANATSPTAALFLRTNTLVANDIFTIQNGQYGNNILRVRDNVTASQSTIGSIFVQARIYGSNSTILGNEFDLGGYGLGASYGDNGSNAVWLNNQGNVGDGTGSSVISVSSNFYVNLQTTKKYKFEAVTGNFGIGNVGTLGARLDVRAQGALSTDIAFRVRNSVDTRNFLTVNGAGDVFSNGAQGVSSNAFYGENSGRNSTGLYNCFFGLEAGRDNSTGANNSFFGVEAGRVNTTGGSNSFFGIQAGRSNTGSSNSFFGASAGYTNSTGTYNSFFGVSSGEGNSTGAFNSCFGFQAGQYNSTGSENVFLGVESGRRTLSLASLTIANNSVFIGGLAKANANSETNQIVIGHSAVGLGSNTTVIGNTSTTSWKLFGAGIVQNITAPSSSVTDSFHVYSNDITAGNAAPHFRTENGSIVKLYQETTGVTTSTLISNVGTTITDTDTFDGYTLQQIVKALRNLGVLQ